MYGRVAQRSGLLVLIVVFTGVCFSRVCTEYPGYLPLHDEYDQNDYLGTTPHYIPHQTNSRVNAVDG